METVAKVTISKDVLEEKINQFWLKSDGVLGESYREELLQDLFRDWRIRIETYSLEQIREAFKETVEKEISQDFQDLAWELYDKFKEELIGK